MKTNPRPDLGAHAPLYLPDTGELAKFEEVCKVLDPRTRQDLLGYLELLTWMGETWWTLLDEIQSLEDNDSRADSLLEENNELTLEVETLKKELHAAQNPEAP